MLSSNLLSSFFPPSGRDAQEGHTHKTRDVQRWRLLRGPSNENATLARLSGDAPFGRRRGEFRGRKRPPGSVCHRVACGPWLKIGRKEQKRTRGLVFLVLGTGWAWPSALGPRLRRPPCQVAWGRPNFRTGVPRVGKPARLRHTGKAGHLPVALAQTGAA